MRVAEALLKSRRMNWSNLFRGIVYLKHPDYLKYFEEYCRKHAISVSNMAAAFADICREDLLCEIELDAFISKTGAASSKEAE